MAGEGREEESICLCCAYELWAWWCWAGGQAGSYHPAPHLPMDGQPMPWSPATAAKMSCPGLHHHKQWPEEKKQGRLASGSWPIATGGVMLVGLVHLLLAEKFARWVPTRDVDALSVLVLPVQRAVLQAITSSGPEAPCPCPLLPVLAGRQAGIAYSVQFTVLAAPRRACSPGRYVTFCHPSPACHSSGSFTSVCRDPCTA